MDGFDLAGRLDSQLFQETCTAAGETDPGPFLETFKNRYHKELKILLDAEKSATAPRNIALPNASAVLESISTMPNVALGILTGNFPLAAKIKLDSVGIDIGSFEISVYGDEAQTRPQMVRLAFKKFKNRFHSNILAKDILIIGDTPRDIQCALENECPCLAVATGRYSQNDLVKAGATWAIPDLNDAHNLWKWLENEST